MSINDSSPSGSNVAVFNIISVEDFQTVICLDHDLGKALNLVRNVLSVGRKSKTSTPSLMTNIIGSAASWTAASGNTLKSPMVVQTLSFNTYSCRLDLRGLSSRKVPRLRKS